MAWDGVQKVPDGRWGFLIAPLLVLLLCRRQTARQAGTHAEQVKGHCHHLVVLPVSKEVDGSVSSGLDDGPAPTVYPLLAPHLQGPLSFIWFDEVHATGGVASILCREAVSERA